MIGEVDFSFLNQPGFEKILDEILQRYSETFFTDINIYDVNGKMLSTTSPELMDLQIQSSLMNAEAFHNMNGEKSLYYSHEEQLGNAKYQSSYIAMQDHTGKTLAYLNIPYFLSQSDLQTDILYYILTYVNIILLIIFIFIPIVLLITRRVTNPLEQLQEKMRELDINKTNEKLEWKSEDEIGVLINQYNQLIVALEESAMELKRTTTESAWRGVARQVAHEIKNSLTPMRLSIQLLQRNMDAGDPDLEVKMRRTTATLIEQIDALSEIASSFSRYAKLPENHLQPLDLAELIGNVVNLYNNVENIEFSYDFDSTIEHVYNGDKTNLNSAIGNIIKNATQAIGQKPDGKIEVKLQSNEKAYVISIKDNGKGIKEEDKKMIFVPNFTTKTGGSGIGLSLTYSIIQSVGGSITFESEENVGTEFVIKLPK
jgi:nitrogen fixation/metabolism regulation signal transduction histidine kinase